MVTRALGFRVSAGPLARGLALLGLWAVLGCRDASEGDPARASLTSTSCERRPFAVAIKTPPAVAVPAGTTLAYTLSVTNEDVGECPSSLYLLERPPDDTSLATRFEPSLFPSVAPGETIDFGIEVTGLPNGDPGPHELVLGISKLAGPDSERQVVRLTYDLAPPEGCFVSKRAELMILTTKVVDDPIRTRGNLDHFASSSRGQGAGVFSFAHLVRALAPSQVAAPAVVERLLSLWLTDQNVNGFVVKARPAMREALLARWPRTPSGELDLERSPLRLQAIVNRMDLRDLGRHSAGEGRFVFAFDVPRFFTLILEYDLPADTEEDVRAWAKAWHALSSHELGSRAYRSALEELTRRFTRRGAAPSRPNGSALLRLRTNENELAGFGDGSSWEMRQFELSPATGFFEEAPVAETPDLSFNGTPTFAAFVTENEAAIAAAIPGSSTGVVPRTFRGSPFLAGSAINTIPSGVTWFADGLDGKARFQASLVTCNGCHGFDTQSIFLQITPREPGSEARLSSFMNGVTINDPRAGVIVLDDLGRRQADLRTLVCPSGPPAGCP